MDLEKVEEEEEGIEEEEEDNAEAEGDESANVKGIASGYSSLLEPVDRRSCSVYSCARVAGMDTVPAIFVVGSKHLYVVDNFGVSGENEEVVDISKLHPDDWVLPPPEEIGPVKQSGLKVLERLPELRDEADTGFCGEISKKSSVRSHGRTYLDRSHWNYLVLMDVVSCLSLKQKSGTMCSRNSVPWS